MRGLSLFLTELRVLLSNRKMLVPVVALFFIPLIYSVSYIWAFWDPTGHTDRLPIAVVNLDEGAVFNEKKVTVGKDLVDKLKKKDSFEWHFVSEKEAERGLEDHDYYGMIKLPKDFSQKTTTLLEDKPTPAEIIFVANEANNYTSSRIGETGAEKIRQELADKLSETFIENVFDNLKDVADGLNKAADGANDLHDGAIKVDDGTSELATNMVKFTDGVTNLQTGANKLQMGSGELAKGTATLSSGLNQLANAHKQVVSGLNGASKGASDLAKGAAQLNDGAQKLNIAAPKLTEGATALAKGAGDLANATGQWSVGATNATNGAKQVAGGITQLKASLTPLLASLPSEQKAKLEATLAALEKGSGDVATGLTQLTDAAGQIQTGATTLSTKTGELASGASQLQAGIAQLTDGQAKLASGTKSLAQGTTKLATGVQTFDEKLAAASTGSKKLVDGSQKLATGTGDLVSGVTTLADGATKLADGSEKLNEGTTKLADGSRELYEKLADAAKESGEVNETAKSSTYKMFADPVKLVTKKMNPVENYGTGLAPYFLGLGLFVGAMMLSIVFPVYEPIAEPHNPFSWFYSKISVLALSGFAQAMIADFVLLYVLDMEVKSVPVFLAFSVLVSWTFMALIQLLVTTLSDAGRFVAILLLVLQLVSSAGTYPIETVPEFLQFFYGKLPMTYVVSGFREIIAKDEFTLIWQNVTMLAGFAGLFMLGTLLYLTTQFKKLYGRKVKKA